LRRTWRQPELEVSAVRMKQKPSDILELSGIEYKSSMTIILLKLVKKDHAKLKLLPAKCLRNKEM
jgi:hypothetical protein